MPPAKFRISNYRCFGESHPLVFDLSPGFTAILGPNNAGKSAILRFFYELRNIWGVLQNSDNLQRLLGGANLGIQFNDVIYQLEPFHKFNESDIEIEIAIPDIDVRFLLKKVDKQNFNLTDLSLKIKNIPIGFGRVTFDPNKKLFEYSDPTTGRLTMDAKGYLDFFKSLAQMVYIPAFRNAINVGELEKYGDMATGTAFINEWNQWKNGYNHWQGQRTQDVIQDIRELFEFTSLDVNASTDRKSMQLTIDGYVYKQHEVGSGIVQFILVFASAALRDPSYILIDEPELNLHPSLQQKFVTSLATYTKHGIIFGTHSIGLTRSIADTIYSVRKTGQDSTARLFGTEPHYPELLGELSFSTYQEMGVEKIFLVEGPTEVRTMQQLLRKLGKDTDVLVINLGGSGMINLRRMHEIAEFKRITPKVFLWIDSEQESESQQPPAERRKFIEECKKLKIVSALSERRSIEHYFSSEVIQKVTRRRVELKPFEKFNPSAHWGKNDNWKLARAMEKSAWIDTDLGKFLNSL